jgi:hypothetical protein
LPPASATLESIVRAYLPFLARPLRNLLHSNRTHAVTGVGRFSGDRSWASESAWTKLARLRLTEKRIVKYQRRVWLAQVLMWPTILIGAVLAVGALVWFLRSRSAGGRHEMPDLPGAHEPGAEDPQANGNASAV